MAKSRPPDTADRDINERRRQRTIGLLSTRDAAAPWAGLAAERCRGAWPIERTCLQGVEEGRPLSMGQLQHRPVRIRRDPQHDRLAQLAELHAGSTVCAIRTLDP